MAVVVLADSADRSARLAVPLAYALYLELLLVPALPFGLASGQWGDPVVPLMVGDSPVLVVALVAIPAFGGMLYLLRFGKPWGAEFLGPRWSAAACVLVPAVAWTALDFGRAKLDPGGLWGPLFLSQADSSAGSLAALAGPWALTLVIVAVNYALALALVRRRPAPAVAAVLLLGVTFGLAAVSRPEPPAETALRVAAIQPGYDTAEEDRAVNRHFEPGSFELAGLDVVRDLESPTRSAAAAGAELVAWPEATMFADPREDPRILGRLRRLARSTGATLLVPYFLPDPDRSEAIVVSPAGRVFGPTVKQRPMWFLGESGGSGPRASPLAAGERRLGVMLGVDSQDPAIARDLADGDAEVIVSATHDWAQLAPQHRAYERLAAVAAGVPLVRADWRYGSAVFGADGSVLADAGEGLDRTVVLGRIAAAGPTPYRSAGDVIGWTAVALSAAAGLATLRSRSRRQPAAAPSEA